MDNNYNKVDDINEIKKVLGTKRGFNEPLIRTDNEEGYNLIHNSNQEGYQRNFSNNTININDGYCFNLCSRFVFITSIFVVIIYSIAAFTVFLKR
jgi:hypothetical protein